MLKEVRERLGFLADAGLDYLTLDRTSGRLSGGEGQRIRLATQLGSTRVGGLYTLDEPAIGPHQRDDPRPLAPLRRFNDPGHSMPCARPGHGTTPPADH